MIESSEQFVCGSWNLFKFVHHLIAVITRADDEVVVDIKYWTSFIAGSLLLWQMVMLLHHVCPFASCLEISIIMYWLSRCNWSCWDASHRDGHLFLCGWRHLAIMIKNSAVNPAWTKIWPYLPAKEWLLVFVIFLPVQNKTSMINWLPLRNIDGNFAEHCWRISEIRLVARNK